MELSDEIVSGFREGSPAAFTSVVRRYSRLIVSLLSPVRDIEARRELVQEAWLKAHRNCGSFDPSISALPNWLGLIAKSVRRDWQRTVRMQKRRGIRCSEDLLRRVESSTPGPEELCVRIDLLTQRRAVCLASMTPLQSQALWLAEVEGFSMEEIAEKTGSTLSGVKCRIVRAWAASESLPKEFCLIGEDSLCGPLRGNRREGLRKEVVTGDGSAIGARGKSQRESQDYKF